LIEIQPHIESCKKNKSLPKTDHSSENAKLKQACADFEAILLDSMFQSMRKTLSGDDIFGKSLGRDIYESMYYTQISKELASEGHGLGLGEILYQQLSSLIENKPDHGSIPGSSQNRPLQKYGKYSDKSIDAS
jgi:peptidoglycan hydrolase FlgJ